MIIMSLFSVLSIPVFPVWSWMQPKKPEQEAVPSYAAEEFFHISIQPEKEIVMILVPERIKDAVLMAVYHSAGMNTNGQGIAFSLPVDKTVGLIPQKENTDSNS